MKTIEELESSLRHNRDWWAARFERLTKWAREKLTPEQQQEFFSIAANGTASPFEQPEYQRVLAMNMHETDQLKHLVAHCWIHSGYLNCGYDHMTTNMKERFDKCIKERTEPLKSVPTVRCLRIR